MQRTLLIRGMTCDSCAGHIEQALAELPGVSAHVSFKDRLAEVSVSHPDQWQAVSATVARLGYVSEEARPRDVPDGSAPGAHVHVVILGGGSAAFAAATRAVARGARVTLIEEATVGGTCVNVGCVPSKILLHAADILRSAATPGLPGIAGRALTVQFDTLLAAKDARVDALRTLRYEEVLRKTPGITFVFGHARFVDSQTVEVKSAMGTERISGDRFLIATGARPDQPAIPGLSSTPYWTSTEALSTLAPVGRLAVIGGGAVALELAQLHARFGSEVAVYARGRLLSRDDADLGRGLADGLRAEGLVIETGVVPSAVRHEGGHFHLTVNGSEVVADRLLVATGRRPATAGIGLDRAGVEVTASGAIVVDAHLRTSAAHIYAAGDCTTAPQYVYVAAAAGNRAATHMTGGDDPLDLTALPRVVFTDPGVASVGLGRDEAGARGIAVESRTLPMSQVPRAAANFDDRGFIRLVAAADGGRLLGAQILAPQAGEIAAVAATALQAGWRIEDLARFWVPYLTWSEGLKLCAQTFTRDISALSCCAA